MSDKNSNDIESFRQAIKDVIPLKKNNRANLHLPAKKAFFESAKKDKSVRTMLPSHWYETWDIEPVGAEQTISYCDDSISPLIFKRFINKWEIEDALDLHGFKIEDARIELHHFLNFAIEQQLTKVLIIHGKGYSTLSPFPKLKNQLNIWLRNHPQILAFHSAPKQNGGCGAVMLMLKSPQKTI